MMTLEGQKMWSFVRYILWKMFSYLTIYCAAVCFSDAAIQVLISRLCFAFQTKMMYV
jgi:hypothetical protein